MPGKHPYISAPGPLIQVIEQLRKSFPPTVAADTLKKLGLAPQNESFVINILKYIGALDEEGKRTDAAARVFSQHDDVGFQKGFRELVKPAYSDLFELHGDDAWSLDRDRLISFFRHANQSSSLVGQRQATTFQALAALSGHGEGPATRRTGGKPTVATKTGTKKVNVSARAPGRAAAKSGTALGNNGGSSAFGGEVPGGHATPGVGLTVRVEINLPAAGDQETYDRIFKSIRDNLLNVG